MNGSSLRRITLGGIAATLLVLLVLLTASPAWCMECRTDWTPWGEAISSPCIRCHISSQPFPPVAPLNSFGLDVRSIAPSDQCSPVVGTFVWQEIYDRDSDGDGFTNGEELQDPDGNWQVGDSNPGQFNRISEPGLSGDTPPVTPSPTPSPTPQLTTTPTVTPTPEIPVTPSPTPALTVTPTPSADFNNDGIVNELDLLILLKQWHSTIVVQ